MKRRSSEGWKAIQVTMSVCGKTAKQSERVGDQSLAVPSVDAEIKKLFYENIRSH